MIIEIWSATISPGKEAEVMDVRKKQAEANKRQLPGLHVPVMRPIAGKFYTIHATLEFESLETRQQFRNNPSDETIALIIEGEQFIDMTSVECNLYQVVE